MPGSGPYHWRPGPPAGACSATTIRSRRDEWVRLGVFARLEQLALGSYDRIVGLVLDQIAVDGPITKAPAGGEAAGRDLADTVITVRSLIRRSWTPHCSDERPGRRP
ncbi:hypothetical protein GCM10010349_68770 [Streptomyces flavofungini]|nr:hypothetical protein GCM10010349_68770 [Streptomyces flavofungini]